MMALEVMPEQRHTPSYQNALLIQSLCKGLIDLVSFAKFISQVDCKLC